MARLFTLDDGDPWAAPAAARAVAPAPAPAPVAFFAPPAPAPAPAYVAAHYESRGQDDVWVDAVGTPPWLNDPAKGWNTNTETMAPAPEWTASSNLASIIAPALAALGFTGPATVTMGAGQDQSAPVVAPALSGWLTDSGLTLGGAWTGPTTVTATISDSAGRQVAAQDFNNGNDQAFGFLVNLGVGIVTAGVGGGIGAGAGLSGAAAGAASGAVAGAIISGGSDENILTGAAKGAFFGTLGGFAKDAFTAADALPAPEFTPGWLTTEPATVTAPAFVPPAGLADASVAQVVASNDALLSDAAAAWAAPAAQLPPGAAADLWMPAAQPEAVPTFTAPATVTAPEFVPPAGLADASVAEVVARNDALLSDAAAAWVEPAVPVADVPRPAFTPEWLTKPPAVVTAPEFVPPAGLADADVASLTEGARMQLNMAADAWTAPAASADKASPLVQKITDAAKQAAIKTAAGAAAAAVTGAPAGQVLATPPGAAASAGRPATITTNTTAAPVPGLAAIALGLLALFAH